MSGPRVFVSYDPRDNQWVERLVGDLQAKGINALIDRQHSLADDQVASSDWLLFVRTPDNMRSLKPKVEDALERVVQQRMPGVLAIILDSATSEDTELPWSIIQTYDGQGENYKTALEKTARLLKKAPKTPEKVLVPVELPTANKTGQTSRSTRAIDPLQGGNSRKQTSSLHLSRQGQEWYRSQLFIVIASIVVGLLLIVGIGYGAISRYAQGPLVTPIHPTPNVTATQAAVSATATAASDPTKLYASLAQKEPVLDDPLTKNKNNWTENGVCAFKSGAYQIIAAAGQFTPCMAQKSNFKDFAYQVQMSINSGDAGGLIFRSDSKVSTFYRFSVDNGGKPSLILCQSCNHESAKEGKSLLDTTSDNTTPSVQQNQQTSWTLAVIVRGPHIYLYNGGLFIQEIDDQSIVSTGEIGLYAASLSQYTKVTFSSVKVWTF